MATSVKEGRTSYHSYEFLDGDDVQVPSVESKRYKLSSATATLIDWTAIAGTAPAGTITIAAEHNIMADADDTRRYVTIEATHNGGEIITDELGYVIVDLVGVVPAE